MKKKYIGILLLSALLFSCSEDMLNVENKNAYDASNFFTNDQTCLEACNATYSALLTSGGWTCNFWRVVDLIGYDAKKNFPLLASFQVIGDYTFDGTTGAVSSIFNDMYKLVFRANFTIDMIDKLNLTDATKIAAVTRYKGEVEFLKALGYFYLVNGWGDIPLRKTLADHSVYQMGRTPKADIWAYIESTLLDAIDKLPVSYAATDYGRVTKGAAIALLGKAYLYQAKYNEALTQFSKLTAAPYDYQLATSLDDMFIYGLKTKETIFPVVHGVWQGAAVANGMVPLRGTEVNAGKITSTVRARDYSFIEWWNTIVSGAIVGACSYNNEAGNPYIDPRAGLIFYDSYSKTGKWNGGDTLYMDKVAGGPKNYVKASAIGRNTAIYSWRKAEILEFTDYVSGQPANDIDFQVIRYADVLLMMAESYIETNQVPLALPLINKVRARSGAFQYTTLGTQTEARAILRRDRTIEFPGECIRYFDLVRWGTLVSQLNAEKMLYEGIAPLKAKHILLPIPQTEKDANPVLAAQVKDDWN